MKDEIKTLIQNGRLGKYVKRDSKRRGDENRDACEGDGHHQHRSRCDDRSPEGGGGTNTIDSQPLGTIHVISGGLDKQRGGPQSQKRLRKSVMKLDYLKRPHTPQDEPIVFIDEELANVDSEEADPMVITAKI